MGTFEDFYSIPRLYDILHAPGTMSDVRVLRRLRRAHVPRHEGPDVWLEPGCGTGRYLRAAARLKVRGIGFDSEPKMVAFARRTARDAGVCQSQTGEGDGGVRIFAARMEDFASGRRLPPVTMAFNLINTIRHLTSDRAMVEHLRSVGGVLRPGGVYVVGISLCAYGLESITEDVWKGSRDGVRVSQVVQYIPPAGARGESARNERVISHLTVRTGVGKRVRERHIDSTYALRGYNLAQWRDVVSRGGLRVVGVTDGEGVPATPREPGYYLFILARDGQDPGPAQSARGARRTRGLRARP
ncbi:MAG: class I SAM-dependent methyltransferase [Planctomycetota bacterium]|nr:class I SAM-dependent methyltransferase [Planctomycetota bacterium]